MRTTVNKTDNRDDDVQQRVDLTTHGHRHRSFFPAGRSAILARSGHLLHIDPSSWHAGARGRRVPPI
jgi:calcineurin-like phosphoesterase family protein